MVKNLQINDDVGLFAAEALGEIRDKSAIPALITALAVRAGTGSDSEGEAPQVGNYAAEALGKFGAEAAEAIPALTKLVKIFKGESRIIVAGALAKIDKNSETAFVALAESLKSKDEYLERQALYNLIDAPNVDRAITTLTNALNDPEIGQKQLISESIDDLKKRKSKGKDK